MLRIERVTLACVALALASYSYAGWSPELCAFLPIPTQDLKNVESPDQNRLLAHGAFGHATVTCTSGFSDKSRTDEILTSLSSLKTNLKGVKLRSSFEDNDARNIVVEFGAHDDQRTIRFSFAFGDSPLDAKLIERFFARSVSAGKPDSKHNKWLLPGLDSLLALPQSFQAHREYSWIARDQDAGGAITTVIRAYSEALSSSEAGRTRARAVEASLLQGQLSALDGSQMEICGFPATLRWYRNQETLRSIALVSWTTSKGQNWLVCESRSSESIKNLLYMVCENSEFLSSEKLDRRSVLTNGLSLDALLGFVDDKGDLSAVYLSNGVPAIWRSGVVRLEIWGRSEDNPLASVSLRSSTGTLSLINMVDVREIRSLRAILGDGRSLSVEFVNLAESRE